VVATYVGGNAAQPSQKTALLWLERPNLPHRSKPGFLHNFVRFVSSASAPPDNETIELIENFQTPHAPRIFVPRQHCPAQYFLPVDAVFRMHAAGSMVAISASDILLSDRHEILRRIFYRQRTCPDRMQFSEASGIRNIEADSCQSGELPTQ
jgi:hypothetical protein